MAPYRHSSAARPPRAHRQGGHPPRLDIVWDTIVAIETVLGGAWEL